MADEAPEFERITALAAKQLLACVDFFLHNCPDWSVAHLMQAAKLKTGFVARVRNGWGFKTGDADKLLETMEAVMQGDVHLPFIRRKTINGKLIAHGSGPNRVYLYQDGTPPSIAYLRRWAQLQRADASEPPAGIRVKRGRGRPRKDGTSGAPKAAPQGSESAGDRHEGGAQDDQGTPTQP